MNAINECDTLLPEIFSRHSSHTLSSLRQSLFCFRRPMPLQSFLTVKNKFLREVQVSQQTAASAESGQDNIDIFSRPLSNFPIFHECHVHWSED